MPTLLRSFFAIILGYIVMMLAVIALTLILVKTMGLKSGHPTPGYLLINVVYSLLAAAIGGWVTAALAPARPLPHAAILAILMCVMGVLSYRHYTGAQPPWYQAMMIVVPSLCALASASLYAAKSPPAKTSRAPAQPRRYRG